jgi:Domain of unknown function (DUF1906)
MAGGGIARALAGAAMLVAASVSQAAAQPGTTARVQPARAALAAATNDTGPLKVVKYRGYSFEVPRSWPVINDSSQPHGCVRFDQHAVYLGAVSGNQLCPSWLLGTTESVLIQPGPAAARPFSAEDEVARSVTSQAPGISLTATFGTDPGVIYRILASARLPAPVRSASSADAAGSGGRQLEGSAAEIGGRAGTAGRAMPSPPLPLSVASYHGRGFDACTAPSRAAMRAWRRHSPYRAIGIYIGGSDRACAQPNLNRAWVRAEASAGWRFIPLYAGPQAAFRELHAPSGQGFAAARDAAAQARRLGFARRTPIYYDMEAYRPSARVAALEFESAWTRELHRLGYSSGVYSSSDSGIVDLSEQYSRHAYAMPNVIYDALWNDTPNTRDRNLRAGQWHMKRIHQYRGNVTERFGGVKINIDQDYMAVRIGVLTAATPQASSAVTLPGGSVDLFYRNRGRLWLDRYVSKDGWSKPVAAGSGASSPPSVVSVGSSAEVFYKDAHGHLEADTYSAAGKLTARRTLTQMGVLGSGPRAVAGEDGVIDVFWHGSADDHLWHAEFMPGSGWRGPQGLDGALGSDPVPVESSPGTTAVLWKGKDASLWSVTRGMSGRWSAPRRLGMGPLGGQPEATAQASGAIQVYWHGKGNNSVWEAFYRPGSGWQGPRDLGGNLRSNPWPASADGAVRVLWRGPGHQLSYITHRPTSQWNAAEWQGPLPIRPSWLGAAPFTAVGSPGAPLRVFWAGRHGRLWTALLRSHRWTKPAPLG